MKLNAQVGILAGHTYVFLQDYWPREMWSRTGKGEVQTPALLYAALSRFSWTNAQQTTTRS